MQVTLNTGAVELLQTSTVDHIGSHARSDVPHVLEGDHGELAAPAHGQGDTTEESEQLVAASFAAAEALVGVAPHTVHGPDAIGFTKNLIEGYLDMIVQVVGIPVVHIEVFGLRHVECWDCRGTTKSKLR